MIDLDSGEFIYYTKGYKYQLKCDAAIQTSIKGFDVETKFFHLYKNGILEVFAGYAWDGPSGPTIDTNTAMRGSLYHDVFYQILRMKLIPQSFRATVDKEFLVWLLADNMNSIRAQMWYYAVDNMANYAASPNNRREIHCAPKQKRNI